LLELLDNVLDAGEIGLVAHVSSPSVG